MQTRGGAWNSFLEAGVHSGEKAEDCPHQPANTWPEVFNMLLHWFLYNGDQGFPDSSPNSLRGMWTPCMSCAPVATNPRTNIESGLASMAQLLAKSTCTGRTEQFIPLFDVMIAHYTHESEPWFLLIWVHHILPRSPQSEVCSDGDQLWRSLQRWSECWKNESAWSNPQTYYFTKKTGKAPWGH